MSEICSEGFVCLHCRKTAPASAIGEFPASNTWEERNGSPTPLGVSWIVREQAWNFALFSHHAESVELLLFRDGELATPVLIVEFDVPRNKSGPIWHCRVPLASACDARYYAYRITGPRHFTNGFDAFDDEKLLLDPYAKSVYFPENFDREAARRPGTNIGAAPMALLNDCLCDSGSLHRVPLRHGSDLIIYEMHVRGFTKHASSEIAPDKRGTFSGVVERIPYLNQLGVTAVELMPVFQFDPEDGNYWGYMPLSFFAVHHSYSMTPDICAQRNEFRTMVDALHAAGIEVILDVVFNHTCEGDHRGPTYSFKGIDNSSYYISSADRRLPYANFSGTGNTLNTSHPAVQQLVLDSLRYWATEMRVDGFRFDLASVFTRRSDGTVNADDPPIFAQIASDPVLSRVRLIAEPWDASGAFHLGRSFPGTRWMQWNASYRDTVQRFVRGDSGMVPDLMTRLYGSNDLFPDDREHAFHSCQSVNYVTSHDGFTLYDLVAFNEKQNWSNGHENTDGHQDFSWNCGHEGDAGVPGEVMTLRRQQVKNFFCLLFLSNGTPMFRMGDEFLQTQGGNNNPYNQDNETSWLDWNLLETHSDIFRFVQRMIGFRKAHPSLCRSEFWRDDVLWFGPDGDVDLSPQSREVALLLQGTSEDDANLFFAINSGERSVSFSLPTSGSGAWWRCLDTSLAAPDDIVDFGNEFSISDSTYSVSARSVVVFCNKATPA